MPNINICPIRKKFPITPITKRKKQQDLITKGYEGFTLKESKIEAYLKQQIERLGGKCWKWESPGKRGVPDRIIILPGPVYAFAETKRTGDSERAQQVYRHKQLRAMGCTVFSTVDSYDRVNEIVDWAKEVMGN